MEGQSLICVFDSLGNEEEEGKEKRKNVEFECKEMMSPITGNIDSICVDDSSILKGGDEICDVSVCETGHAVHWGGLCSTCGVDVSSLLERNVLESVCHAHPKLSINLQEAKKMDEETRNKLLSEKKLSLVLDLDHTLLHATTKDNLQCLPNVCQKKCEHPIDKDCDCNIPLVDGLNMFSFKLQGQSTPYFVRMRPFLADFFEALRPLYEMHIYTMGTRHYATAIAEIVDDTSTLFHEHRIVSRDECQDGNSKNLRLLFPCEDSMAVIVDDREDVWANPGVPFSPNLITIKPFRFFPFRDRDPDDPTSFQEWNSSSPPESDDALLIMKDILISLHRRYYSLDFNSPDQDTKFILHSLRTSVLQGCCIVFSGFSNHSRDSLKLLAERYGAACFENLEVHITHLVARTFPSSETRKAHSMPGVKVVDPGWLQESAHKWKCLDETPYLLIGDESCESTDIPEKRLPESNTQVRKTKRKRKFDDGSHSQATPEGDDFDWMIQAIEN